MPVGDDRNKKNRIPPVVAPQFDNEGEDPEADEVFAEMQPLLTATEGELDADGWPSQWPEDPKGPSQSHNAPQAFSNMIQEPSHPPLVLSNIPDHTDGSSQTRTSQEGEYTSDDTLLLHGAKKDTPGESHDIDQTQQEGQVTVEQPPYSPPKKDDSYSFDAIAINFRNQFNSELSVTGTPKVESPSH